MRKKMTECIAVVNQKGGVGKSTTVQALGAGLFLKGYKVLFVDMDAQGNLTYAMGVNASSPTVSEVLTGKAKIDQALVRTAIGDLLPSNPDLSLVDKALSAKGKAHRLRIAIDAVKHIYSYILIDTSPFLGITTLNALTASDSVIIPTQADVFSLQGINKVGEVVNSVKSRVNPSLSIKGILLTRHNSRAVLSQQLTEMMEQVAKSLGTRVFKTKIRECIAIKEAQAYRKDIFSYMPKSNASRDYKALVDEIQG